MHRQENLMSEIRNKAARGLKAGDTFTALRTFTEQDVIRFADITRDYNPVHFDERFAKKKNFRGSICHGLLAAAMITEIGGQIGWLASGLSFAFKRPIYPGETVICYFTVTEIDEKGRAKAEAVYKNQAGAVVLEAMLTGILPGPAERKIMQEMLAEGDPTNKVL